MSFRTIYGHTHSEAGWRMCNRDECVLVPGPYMNTAPLRRGAPEIILGDFVRRYHAQCAPVVSPVWGWSATNDVATSNHLSGTAVDINAPQWPWGVRKMPADLIGRINHLLAFYEGAVFWGRNWNKPDEMHFQMGWGEGDSRLQRIINKIVAPPPPPPPPPNAIAEQHQRSPWLGKKLTPQLELATPDGRGRFAAFEHGHIYWTTQTGAWPIPARMFDVYAELGFEKGPLGYPVAYHTVLKDGDVQAFERGVLYRKYDQPGFYITGLIGDRYRRSGYEKGPLGWPTTNETPFPGGVYQTFEHGRIVWSPDGTIALKPGLDTVLANT